jgi:TolB protein
MQTDKRRLLLLAAGLALLLASLLPSAELLADAPILANWTITNPGKKSLPIAVPKPKGDGSAVDEFWSVVRRDLEISGWFRVLDPDGFIEPEHAGVRAGEFDFDDWKTPGAAVLAKTVLTSSGANARAEVWVYDVAGAEKIDARAFSGQSQRIRSVAHRVSNAIIEAVTNKPGIFATRFAAVNARSGNKEIYLVDIPITRNGSINLQPNWSPNGTSLVYTSYRAGNPDLYVTDLTNATTRRISARKGLNTGGTFSPLGDIIAATLSLDGNSDVYTIAPTSGKQIARLTTNPGIDTSPNFSPDGSKIAFVSERSGGAQIYVMSADGGDARRVTFHGGHNTDPAWSPDGQRLAYVSRDGRFDVFTCGLDGRGVVRITQGQGDNEDPSWAPNSQYIGFSSTRTGTGQIWMSTADGYHHVQITQDKGGWSNPSWSPYLSW